MEREFLDFINEIPDPFIEDTALLKELNERIETFIIYVKKQERAELKFLPIIREKLQTFGAYTDISNIYKENAEFYRNKNYKKYILNIFKSLSWRIRSYATELEKEQIIKYIEEAKNKKCTSFCPLFLNLLGVYRQLYEGDPDGALKSYSEAIDLLENIDGSTFHSVTTYDYSTIKEMTRNNLIDSMVHSENPEKYREEIVKAGKKVKESKNIYSLGLRLIIAEFYAKEGETEKSRKILSVIDRNLKKEIVYYYPEYYVAKSQIAVSENDLSGAFDHMKKSCKYAFNLGKPLSLKQNLMRIFRIISSTLEGLEFHEKIEIFKEKSFIAHLLNYIGVKDRYLAMHHSQNVADLALMVYKNLPLKSRNNESLYISGLFHDIGKLSIPRYTLSKPSILKDEDREIVKYHTLEGYRILKMIDFEDAAIVARDHHERLDGKGYLKGKKDLNIETQIIALSDEYVAACSPNRLYKEPKSSISVLKEIEREVKMGKFSQDLYRTFQNTLTRINYRQT